MDSKQACLGKLRPVLNSYAACSEDQQAHQVPEAGYPSGQ